MAGSAKTDEMEVAEHLSDLANGHMMMPDFLARHGFHGPISSELSSVVWREDAAAVERLLPGVRNSGSASERRARGESDREAVIQRVLASLPIPYRIFARAVLKVAPFTARALEQCKASMLMSTDGGRAAVRAIGDELVQNGTLRERDQAFHLFSEELLGSGLVDIEAAVAERLAVRAQCLAVEIPTTWEGQPVAGVRAAATLSETRISTLDGIGASPGIVEGTVRVVFDSDDDIDIEPGEILVCPTTDPSWLGLMTIAAAVVIDLGAIASHGAIVARELGLPCVTGTRTGTTDLRDGDRVRVDGGRGLVQLIDRIESQPR